MRLRLLLYLLLGLLILSALLYYIRPEEVVGTFTKLNSTYLALGFISLLMYFFTRAIRWNMLLGTSRSPGIMLTFSATGLGYFINVVLPLRVGEFARALAISRKSGVSFMHALATIVVERVFDLAYLVSFLGISTAFITGLYGSESIKLLSILSYAVLVCIVIFLVLSVKRRRLLSRILALIFGRLLPRTIYSKLNEAVDALLNGLELSSKQIMSFRFHVLSFLITVFNVASLIALTSSTGVWIHLMGMFAGSTIIAISYIVPAPPGNVGTFELIWTATFMALGLEYWQALSSGIVVHVVLTTYLLAICGGASLLLGKDVKKYMSTSPR